MAITNDVNVNLLNNCFELGPFYGLCKPHNDDILNPKSPETIKEVLETKISIGSETKVSNENGIILLMFLRRY